MRRVVEFVLLFVPLFGLLLWVGGDVRRLRLGWRQIEEREKRLAEEVLLTRRGYFVRRMGRWRLHRYDTRGKLLLKAAADDAQALSAQVFSLKNLTATLISQKNKQQLSVSSPKATVTDKPKTIIAHLYGGVTLSIKTVKRVLTIRCESLRLSARSQEDVTISSDTPLTLSSGEMTLYADGFNGTTRTDLYILKGPIKVETITQDKRKTTVNARTATVDASDSLVTIVMLKDVRGCVDDMRFSAAEAVVRLEGGCMVSFLARKDVRIKSGPMRILTKEMLWYEGKASSEGEVLVEGEGFFLRAKDVLFEPRDKIWKVVVKGGVEGKIQEWKMRAKRMKSFLTEKGEVKMVKADDVQMHRSDGLSLSGKTVSIHGEKVHGEEVTLKKGKEHLKAGSLTLRGETFYGRRVQGCLSRDRLVGHFTASEAEGTIVKVFGEYLIESVKSVKLIYHGEDGVVITSPEAKWNGNTLKCERGVVVKVKGGTLQAKSMLYTPREGSFEAERPCWDGLEQSVKAFFAKGVLHKGTLGKMRACRAQGNIKGIEFTAGVAEKKGDSWELFEDVKADFEGGWVRTPRAYLWRDKGLLKAGRAEGCFVREGKKFTFSAQDITLRIGKGGILTEADFGRIKLSRREMVLESGRGWYSAMRGVVELKGKVEVQGKTKTERSFSGSAEEAELRLTEEVVWLRKGVRAEFEGWFLKCGFCVFFFSSGCVGRVYVGGGVEGTGPADERFVCRRALFEKGVWSAEGAPALFERKGLSMREKRIVYDTKKEEVRTSGGYDWDLDPSSLRRFNEK